MTIETILSLGLAAAAFAGFLRFYGMVRQEHAQFKRFANSTLFLQSKVEEVRSGVYGPSLDKLTWFEFDQGGTNVWKTTPQTDGRYSWHLTAENNPAGAKLFAFKTVLTWQEGKRTNVISAATQMVLP